MNIVYLFFGVFLFMGNSTTTSVDPAEIATRMCDCGQQYEIPKLANQYKAANEDSKEVARTELLNGIRQLRDCAKLQEVQLQVRELSTAERSHFEDNVELKLTEQCSEVAEALQALR